MKEVLRDKESYKQISIRGTKPYDVSSGTLDELQKYLTSNADDSLRIKLKADSIEFHDDSDNKFGIDSIVLFKKHNYFVLYDFAERHRELGSIINKIYLKKLKIIDSNLYLIKQ